MIGICCSIASHNSVGRRWFYRVYTGQELVEPVDMHLHRQQMGDHFLVVAFRAVSLSVFRLFAYRLHLSGSVATRG
jgi:hypothetical protein